MGVEISTGLLRQQGPQARAQAQEAGGQLVVQPIRNRIATFRIGFGLLWLIDAWYKWQPAFLQHFASQITRPARTAPALLHGWYQIWGSLVTPHATLFGVATAVTETLIAACLVLGLARRPVYLLGALFSLVIWAMPESFGRFWTAGQTDLGTAILYVFIFVALYVVDAGGGAGGWSLDARLGRHLPWWKALADP